MSLVISDPAILAALAAAKDGVDVRDSAGRLVGFFRPPVEIQYPELGVTREELDRRRKLPSSECVSGEEVLARLHSLRDQS